MTKRIYCLNPDEREKECVDHAYRYLGRIPNTGPQACVYCGERKPDPPVSIVTFTHAHSHAHDYTSPDEPHEHEHYHGHNSDHHDPARKES